MRLLVLSTLFPYPGQPHHGIFVQERVRAYLARQGGEAVVVAPVPYLPSWLARGRYASLGTVPAEERRDGLRVLHPRYPLLPKLSPSVAPLSLALRCAPVLTRLRREGFAFDLIDAHYLFPDAAAATILARRFRCPVVVTARGSDVSLLPQYRLARAWIRWTLRRASAVVAVAEALKSSMQRLSGDRPITVVRNGVDLQKFQPVDMRQARRELGWDRAAKVVLSVGHLIERKGHHHLLSAVRLLPGDVEVKIVGTGPWEDRLRRQARELGVADRVTFVGSLPHERLRLAYAAADLLALLSSREGWPNVLLEAMACGTPVVATNVWGTPEVVQSRQVGRLLSEVGAEVVAGAVAELLSEPRDRAAIRRYAERFSWAEVVEGLEAVFQSALGTRPGPR